MYCPKCGTNNPDVVSSCQKCGYAFFAPTPPQSVPQPQAFTPPPARPNVPNYLVPSILVTILCCLPFGIVALIFASQVNGKLAAGNIQGAIEDSRKAKIWVIVSLATGIIPMILIFAAILIPNVLRSRNVANEASAVGSVRTINTAEYTYAHTYPHVGYTCTIQELGSGLEAGSNVCAVPNGRSQRSACLIDNTLSGGVKSGYLFTLENCAGDSAMTHYEVIARPIQQGAGGRTFCSDQTGIIRYTTTSRTLEGCLTNGTPLR
ncbi:hypothetical protein Acid345_1887 [Candidatus Koribacter versatilis Ellin345]|uniref:Uncharacterized protein n=1 Tax=Koribacter versatilis (strain Ellin345) TaxID=204669 RepID=Q1IQG2_KORVE|nr:CD225/dispanin family protein [Candidatus Koribacter versatilis]ABF40888.1 hypothetical protein Acid345_1887 [Candidatus Koribacter versatilis Ellin345]